MKRADIGHWLDTYISEREQDARSCLRAAIRRRRFGSIRALHCGRQAAKSGCLFMKRTACSHFASPLTMTNRIRDYPARFLYLHNHAYGRSATVEASVARSENDAFAPLLQRYSTQHDQSKGRASRIVSRIPRAKRLRLNVCLFAQVPADIYAGAPISVRTKTPWRAIVGLCVKTFAGHGLPLWNERLVHRRSATRGSPTSPARTKSSNSMAPIGHSVDPVNRCPYGPIPFRCCTASGFRFSEIVAGPTGTTQPRRRG